MPYSRETTIASVPIPSSHNINVRALEYPPIPPIHTPPHHLPWSPQCNSPSPNPKNPPPFPISSIPPQFHPHPTNPALFPSNHLQTVAHTEFLRWGYIPWNSNLMNLNQNGRKFWSDWYYDTKDWGGVGWSKGVFMREKQQATKWGCEIKLEGWELGRIWWGSLGGEGNRRGWGGGQLGILVGWKGARICFYAMELSD